MNSITAAMAKARSLLAFVGVMSLLGTDWTTWGRVSIGLALVVTVAISSTADGHRLWPRPVNRPARFGKAA